MEILVTGPDGVLGSNLVRELLKRNYFVSVLLEPGKDPITLKDLPINRFYGNILDKNALESAFVNKEIVFHCAASTSMFPARSEIVNKVNIEGTQNVVDLSLKHSIKKLIYVGTANSFGYGTSQENPGKEGNPYVSAKFGLDYMDSKYYAQQLILTAVREQNLPALVVNPTFMIGPYDSRPSSGAMVLGIYNRKVPGYTVGGKNYVAVKDVTIAMANAITLGKIGECYIVGNVNLGYKEAFEKIAKTVGVKAPQRKLSTSIVKTYGSLNSFFAKVFGYYPAVTKELAVISCENHFYSPEKARKELNMPTTPIEVAIKECFDWFEQNGYLTKK
jgi:dihydroflavonol-4-reductase